MHGTGDVGVHLDVNACVVGVGAERVSGLAADALPLEIRGGHRDGVDGGAEPCCERACGWHRAVGEL